MNSILKKSILFFLFFTSASLFFGCNGKKFNLPVKDLIITKSDGSTVNVKSEIAAKTEERNYGFMFRKHIPKGTGMLFVFERDQVLSFWMHNTPTPLSIAYIDSTGKIRSIHHMNPFSDASTVSTCSVRYALEVPQGWFKEVGVKAGDIIDLSPIAKH